MLINNIVIEPMTSDFILWRCLHSGPLSHNTINQWPLDPKMPWERYRTRNKTLLLKLTQVYGSCAILARDSDLIIGVLRFYPKVVYEMEGAGFLCLQQDCDQLNAEQIRFEMIDIVDKEIQGLGVIDVE